MLRFLCILAAITAIGLAGCGQTGPLYLPDSPPPKSKDDSEFDAQPARPATQPTSPQP